MTKKKSEILVEESPKNEVEVKEALEEFRLREKLELDLENARETILQLREELENYKQNQGTSSVPTSVKNKLAWKLAEVTYAISIDPIKKNGKHSFQGYTYPLEADIVSKIGRELSKRHVDLEISTTKREFLPLEKMKNEKGKEINKATVIVDCMYTFTDAESGETDSFSFTGVGDNQQGDFAKALKSAYTNCNTYALTKRFLSPTGNDPELDDVELYEQEKKNPSGGNRNNNRNQGNRNQNNRNPANQNRNHNNRQQGNKQEQANNQSNVTVNQVTELFKTLSNGMKDEQIKSLTLELKNTVKTNKSKFADYSPAELTKAHVFLQNKKSAQSN